MFVSEKRLFSGSARLQASGPATFCKLGGLDADDEQGAGIAGL